jgi:leucyl/phenylalanyl-tRNA--protein transferase
MIDTMELTPAILLQAYSVGIFPMAQSAEDDRLVWFDPDPRGILPLGGFHLSRRLARTVRKTRLTVTTDTAFEAVIDGCAHSTEWRPQTWINDTIRNLCLDLHRMGHAHSIEVWDGPTLVGGLYGVALGAAFFGESMFSSVRDASKIALVHLVARLRKCGFVLLDTQFTTKHLSQFGAIEIPRSQYRAQLKEALSLPLQFQFGAAGDVLGSLVHSSTQIS